MLRAVPSLSVLPLCIGTLTEVLPGQVRTTWLPDWRATVQPSRTSARISRSALSCASRPTLVYLLRRLTTWPSALSQSRMASAVILRASWIVSASVTTPGSAGTSML